MAKEQDVAYNEHIYHYSQKIETEKKNIESLVKQGKLSEFNKDLILEFCHNRKYKKNFTDARISKLLNKLKLIALILKKDFNKVDSKDIDRFLEHINSKKDIGNETKADYLIILRIFYKWYLGNDKTIPHMLEDLKINYKKKRRLPSEILTQEDVISMMNSATSLRDRAIISLLADAGLRVSELINLKFRNLSYNKEEGTMKILVETGKTGGRYVLLIPSVPFLSAYVNSIPNKIKSDQNSYLFLRMDSHGIKYLNDPMTYASMVKMLKYTSKKCNVDKSVNPHAWRRYSATSSASFMTDTALMKRYGWSKRETVNAYTFMNETQAEEVYKQKFGIGKQEQKENKTMPIKCSCGTYNVPDSLCLNCGKPNSLKVAIKIEEEKNNEIKELKEIILILAKGNKEAENKLKSFLTNNIN